MQDTPVKYEDGQIVGTVTEVSITSEVDGETYDKILYGDPALRHWKGPRNLPKLDARKKARKAARAARKRNRGAYSGQ